jgi:hypothetical protein
VETNKMRVLLVVFALGLAVAAGGCAKNSISSPCFADNLSGGFGSSCGSNR